METVASADGTAIAYERLGDGPPVVVVGGALCDRARMREIAEALAARYTVLNYDRRGRGDSGNTPPYAVEREVEDIAALLPVVGGAAAVYGHSSGAALALHAAASGLPITRLVMHEPPFTPDEDEHRRVSTTYHDELRTLLAGDRRDDAVALFLSITGMPAEMIAAMRAEPWWAPMAATAPTLAYDSAAMGHAEGGTVPAHLLGKVGCPALVVAGGDSPEWMIDTARRIAAGMPAGRHLVLPGQGHVTPPEVLVPVLAEFLDEEAALPSP